MKVAAVVMIALLATSGATAQPRTGLISVGDAQINYELSGAGTPIVFIHGWAQDLSIWDDQVAAFFSSYRVIRYDNRGFGNSTGHADITEDPNDLRILLDSLGIRVAHVVGLSRGARVALSFAVTFPDRVDALVLYGTSPPEGFQPAPTGPSIVTVFSEIARRHGMDSVTKALWASPLVWLSPDTDARREYLDRFQPSWAKYKGRDLLDPRPPSGHVPLVRVDQLGAVRVPTLVINGDHDVPAFLVVGDTLARRIPNARRVVLRNAGHGAHLYDPRQFNDAVLGFFKSVDKR